MGGKWGQQQVGGRGDRRTGGAGNSLCEQGVRQAERVPLVRRVQDEPDPEHDADAGDHGHEMNKHDAKRVVQATDRRERRVDAGDEVVLGGGGRRRAAQGTVTVYGGGDGR